MIDPVAASEAAVSPTPPDGPAAPATLYLKVITPAMHEVGRLWESARITVAQEHLSTQITQVVIAALGTRLGGVQPVGAGRVASVSSTPGERHALGGSIVGGRAYRGDEVRARQVGADAFADDPETLLELLERRFAQNRFCEIRPARWARHRRRVLPLAIGRGLCRGA